ncbi:MAG: type I restriction enzyme HsdR N-terminal domain-containing protein [Tannerella sp.]|nr:type I restriction enzyme HsdR N-terminal domain-containing protein [Tannerella sp.]
MNLLNLPYFEPRVSQINGKYFIFDPIRRKHVMLTPEEWVRQHFVNYLITEKGCPKELLANEVSVSLNNQARRCDTIIYNRNLKPLAIVEYKAPSVRITQDVFEQIARYNISLHVACLLVSNGLEHYGCRIDYGNATYTYLEQIPAYHELTGL